MRSCSSCGPTIPYSTPSCPRCSIGWARRTNDCAGLAAAVAATLVGIDGIVTVPGGVVGIQNGTDPQRVIRVAFTPALDAITGVTVLASGLANLTDLGLVTLANGRPTFIAGAGWDGFDVVKIRQPPTHTVRIFQVPLPP